MKRKHTQSLVYFSSSSFFFVKNVMAFAGNISKCVSNFFWFYYPLIVLANYHRYSWSGNAWPLKIRIKYSPVSKGVCL